MENQQPQSSDTSFNTGSQSYKEDTSFSSNSQPQQTSPTQSGIFKSPKVFGAIVGTIILVGLVGGAFASYVFLGGMSRSLEAEALLSKAFINMADVDALTFDATMSIQGDAVEDATESPVNMNIDVNLSGGIDQRIETNMLAEAQLEIAGQLDTLETGQISLGLGAEMRIVERVLYGRISDISIAFLDTGDPQAVLVKNMFDMYKGVFSGKWIAIEADEAIDTVGIPDQLSSQQQARSFEVFAQENKKVPAINVRLAGSERIGDIQTKRIEMSIDPVAFLEMSQNAKRILVDEGIVDENEIMTTREIERMQEEYRQASLDAIEIIVWINEDATRIHKIELVENSIVSPDNPDTLLTISGVVTFDRFNESFEVIAPANAQSFEDVMNEFFQEMFGARTIIETQEIPVGI